MNPLYPSWLLCSLFLFFLSAPSFAQTILWQEDFETDGNGSRYNSTNEFNDGTNDHFQRTDGSDISTSGGAYSGQNGTFYFACEDTDDTGSGADGNDYKAISFNQINSTGWTNLQFLGLFAKGNSTNYDYVDGVIVSYSIDGGSFIQALKFRYVNGQNDAFNENLVLLNTIDQNCLMSAPNGGFMSSVDCDTEVPFPFTNTGGALSTVFTTFSFSIPDGTTTIDVLIEVTMDSGSEEFAFDNFRIQGTAPPAPVELMSFVGERQDDAVALNWETATETNNDHFMVERSVDGKNFSAIGKVAGAFTAYSNQNYDFEDANPPQAPELFYRLRQVDIDGAFTFSEVINIEGWAIKEGFELFPNPATTNVVLQPAEAFREEATLEVFDIFGRLLRSEVLAPDQPYYDLNVNALPQGSYLISVRTVGSQYSQFLVRQ
ncbi:MAG: T9SS type A sorting domain-containing protein [Bacteroidota bacterium]